MKKIDVIRGTPQMIDNPTDRALRVRVDFKDVGWVEFILPPNARAACFGAPKTVTEIQMHEIDA